jgi:hypothetical protein
MQELRKLFHFITPNKFINHPKKMKHKLVAGQEGFEPPTIRFGVCCSTVRATGLSIISFLYVCHVFYIENKICLNATNQPIDFLRPFESNCALYTLHKPSELSLYFSPLSLPIDHSLSNYASDGEWSPQPESNR